MRTRALVFSVFVVTAPQASGGSLEVDRYIASLNSPEIQDRLSLKEVRRFERIANRLEVTFDSHPSPAARSQTLQQIGREFLQVLFRYEFIPVAVVVERNASGRIVGSLVVSVSGRPVVGPETFPQASDPC